MTAPVSPDTDLKPRITVIGVGGAGSNAVNNMIRSNLEGVEFIVCNTDAQALVESLAPTRLQLGLKLTQGLGAGSRPEVGRAAAEETMEEILSHLRGTNMLFITAGMGGGTGTGGAPSIAKAARELGILTVGVVTKPFHFEGTQRMKTAERGIEEMYQCVDTLLVIPNQNLFRVANERTTFADAFAMADNILHSGVRTFTDLMIQHGLINLDFADICVVMREMMGKAMMGTGQAVGERRAIDAAEMAISCPLLDDVSMRGARAVLINVTGGLDMTLFEVDEAANRIREEVAPDANIIFGATFDESVSGQIRVSVVATGIDVNDQKFLKNTREEDKNTGLNAPQFSPADHSLTPDLSIGYPSDVPTNQSTFYNFSEEHTYQLKEEPQKENNQKLGHKHDFFSFEYTQGSGSSAVAFEEQESPFSVKKPPHLSDHSFASEEGPKTPPLSFPTEENMKHKPLGFFGRLAAGVQRRGSSQKQQVPPHGASSPFSTSEENRYHTPPNLSGSGARQPSSFLGVEEKLNLSLNPDDLEIPAFLRQADRQPQNKK